MSNNPKIPFEVPNEMRDLAEKSLAQARRAVETFMEAAHHAASGTESLAGPAKDASQRSVEFASDSVKASFEMMQQLVHAKGMDEVLKVQSDFMQNQMKFLTEHAQAMGEAFKQATGSGKSSKK